MQRLENKGIDDSYIGIIKLDENKNIINVDKYNYIVDEEHVITTKIHFDNGDNPRVYKSNINAGDIVVYFSLDGGIEEYNPIFSIYDDDGNFRTYNYHRLSVNDMDSSVRNIVKFFELDDTISLPDIRSWIGHD
jgi:hypothetical protein